MQSSCGAVALLLGIGILPWAGAPVAARADDAATATRFALDAEWGLLGRSADGRYALASQARFTPGSSSADARFTLRSSASPGATCEPQADPLFANGFEAP